MGYSPMWETKFQDNLPGNILPKEEVSLNYSSYLETVQNFQRSQNACNVVSTNYSK